MCGQNSMWNCSTYLITALKDSDLVYGNFTQSQFLHFGMILMLLADRKLRVILECKYIKTNLSTVFIVCFRGIYVC